MQYFITGFVLCQKYLQYSSPDPHLMISNASNVALHSAFSTLCTNVTDGRSQYHTDGKKGFYTKIGSVSRSDDDIVLVVVDSVQLCRQNDETRDKRSTFG